MIALLKQNSLTALKRFTAEKFALNLSERSSTATITVGPEAPEIAVNDWLKDESGPGAGIVWRVKSVATDYATDTRTISCEHMAATLKDAILFGEVTPAMIANKKKATTCTAKDAVTYILKQSAQWTIGTFGFDKSAPYNFNGDSLFDALETVSSSLLNAWWSYDFSKYPFKLNINPKSTAVACEMRMDRNIASLKRTIDRTRMFTRFYPIGKNDMHLSLKVSGKTFTNYVEKNADVYGAVAKVETDTDKDTQQKLYDWAVERLNNHCEPAVTISISGLDLSAATGEALDKLTLGTVCRVPLPEYGTTITEPITQLSWGDKIADPESVSVTLANVVEDVATIVNQLSKSAGSGGRKNAKDQKEDHAWIEDTDDHVSMIAEALDPGSSKNWSRVSSWNVGPDGILGKVTYTENAVVQYETRFEQNETSIGMVVKVNKNGTRAIEAGKICLAINKDKSVDAVIKADKIKLLGETIAQKISSAYIYTKIANMANVSVKKLTSERGGIVVKSVSTTEYHQGGVKCYVPHAVTSLQIVQDGDTYTLQRKWFSESDWTDVGSFSRATALSGAWAGGVFTVTASPQGNTCKTTIVGDTATRSGQSVSIPVNARMGESSTQISTGKTLTAVITLNNNEVSCTRGSRSTTEPTTDGTIAKLTANGWYTLTIDVLNVSKTYKLQADIGTSTTLSGAWESGVFTVTASPQGNTCLTTLAGGTASRSGRTVTIPVKATIGDSATQVDTGKSVTATITAAKSEVSCTRGTRSTTEPTTTDSTIAKITANGWYIVTVEVLGCTKTYKMNIAV